MKSDIGSIIVTLTFAFLLASPTAAQTVSSSTADFNVTESYKAVVKINTFVMSSGYNLSKSVSGSGVIISDSGLLLTNNHVIELLDEFDNSAQPAAYQVCLPKNTTDEPDCSYMADLIAKNKDLDLALLRIKTAGADSSFKFPYLEIATDTGQISDEVMAIGYPGIGDSTVTVTRGIVSGKTERYGKQWIKTDAMISFGSSGGAAINKRGQLTGITSAGHADFLGSLGYIIDISSVNGWLSANRGKRAIASRYESQLADFNKIEKSIISNPWFASSKYGFKIRRPEGWDFDFTQEDSLSIYKKDDEDAGSISIEVFQTADSATMSKIDQIISELRSTFTSSMPVLSVKSVKIAGIPAKMAVLGLQDMGTEAYVYYVPIDNNILKIAVLYGKDDKDRAVIEGSMNSIARVAKAKFSPIKKYSQADPAFSISTNRDWSVFPEVSRSNPITLSSNKYLQIDTVFIVGKLSKELAKYNNDGWMKYKLSQIDKMNKSGEGDIKVKVLAKNSRYKLNGTIKDAIRIETETKDTKKNKSVGFNVTYIIRRGDKNLGITISDTSSKPDRNRLKKAEKEILAQLQTMTLSDKKFGNAMEPKAKDSDNDGLSDAEESSRGTDPNNKDTDGDGYADGLEVRNGFNPLGAGRL